MASLALFDLDGTLTNPVPGLIATHRFALDQIGLNFDELVSERSSVEPAELVRSPAAELYGVLGVPDDATDRALMEFRDRRPISSFVEDELYPGVADLLASLETAGWRLGVATNQFEPVVERILDRLSIADHFETVVGSDVARTRIVKSRVLSHLQSQLVDPPDGIVVIADRGSDMEAAKEHEMTAIGAAWGFGSIEELMGANADAIAVTPSDVADLLLDP